MIEEAVKVFRDLTNVVSNNLIGQLQGYDPNITVISFYQGHLKEIQLKLSQKDDSNQYKYTMFPAICLLEDYLEDVNPRVGIGLIGTYKVLLINQTDANYTSEERDTKNFEPVLWPMYNELIAQLTYDKRLETTRPYVHRRIKRKYWGRPEDYFTGKDSNLLVYPIDAIELDLPVSFNLNYCNTLKNNLKTTA